MEIGSIFLVLALLLLVALFVSRPLLEAKLEPEGVEQNPTLRNADHERSALLAERDRILNALQELDLDYSLGKIPAQDYPVQRASLVKRGADTLRSLDALSANGATGGVERVLEPHLAGQPVAVASMELEVEGGPTTAAVPRHPDTVTIPAGSSNGRKLPPPGVSAPDDDLEILLANRRRVRQEKAAGFCPQCGGPMQKSDRFCPKCGARLS